MQIQRGRLIDHLHLKVRDLAASRRLYGAVLGVLGIDITDGNGYLYADELWVDEGTPGQITHAHFAFQAKDRETVDAFYKAGLAADGRDNGGPGERDYHPVTTRHSCWVGTGTMWRRSTTGRTCGRWRRWWSVGDRSGTGARRGLSSRIVRLTKLWRPEGTLI